MALYCESMKKPKTKTKRHDDEELIARLQDEAPEVLLATFDFEKTIMRVLAVDSAQPSHPKMRHKKA